MFSGDNPDEDLQYPEDIEYEYEEEEEESSEHQMDVDTAPTASSVPNQEPGTTQQVQPAERRYIMTSSSARPPRMRQVGSTGPKQPKQIPAARKFGSIPDVHVGKTFDSREEASIVHPPRMAGIYADKDGAYSVVLSGGYVDDKDDGDIVTYTGEGGRNPKVSEKTGKESFSGVQARDQQWVRGNEGLRINSVTRKPIRLIRGPWDKLKSKYAHASKYRYDGLYTVEEAYEAKGEEGFIMCKFKFKRLPDQPPIPILIDYDKQMAIYEKKRKSQRRQTAKRDSEEMEVESSATRAEKRARLGRTDVPADRKVQLAPWSGASSSNPPVASSSRVKLEPSPPALSKPPPTKVVTIVPQAPSQPSPFFTERKSVYANMKFNKIKKENPT